MPKRRLAYLLLLSSCVFWGGGCPFGEGAAKTGTEVVKSRGLRATTNALRFAADETVPGSRIAVAATFFDEAVSNRQAIRNYLDKLANSPDPYGQLLTSALCTGMQQLADRPEDEGGVSDDVWTTFLTEEVGILAPNNPREVIAGKVNAFVTAAQLANISPQAAKVYYEECVKRPR